MTDPDQPRQRWLVAALIAAWQLPDEPTEVLGCTIEKLPDAPAWTPEVTGGGPTMQPTIENRGAPIAIVPPNLKFFAYHRVLTTVEAEDEDAAITAATDKFRCLVGALGVIQSVPQAGPVFRIYAAAQIPEGATPGQALPAIDQNRLITLFGGVIVNPLSTTARQQLHTLDQLSSRDGATNGILRLWALAEEAHRFTFSPQDLQDALLAYSRVLERIADVATPDPRPDVSSDIKSVAATLRDALLAELAKDQQHQSSRVLAAAIKDAQDKIAELRYQTIGLRLKNAAALIGAPADLAGEVHAVWKLRSDRAGHDAAMPPTTFEVASARVTVWRFLQHYFVWKSIAPARI